ncbi:MAG: Ku protein [Candidatus Korobacteraceae bacterium]|jgi:DNA end-binding protein Ku
MPASVWSGYLTFGLISVPVRLYSGARGTRISFHMLHRDDLSRVKQQLVCAADNRVLQRQDIVKGYEYRKGEYVVLEPEEIRKIEPKTAKAMEILQFVRAGEVDPLYFESSYYLTPEEGGKRPYALLSRAMDDNGYYAIAKLTMHNREYTVILRPYRRGLMLHTMYYQEEVRAMESFGAEAGEIREAELKIANQLIEALAGKFEPSRYHDTFQENLKKLIKARLEGRELPAVEKPAPAPVTDLMSALRQSLEQMGKKPAARAGAGLPAARSRPRRKAAA